MGNVCLSSHLPGEREGEKPSGGGALGGMSWAVGENPLHTGWSAPNERLHQTGNVCQELVQANHAACGGGIGQEIEVNKRAVY